MFSDIYPLIRAVVGSGIFCWGGFRAFSRHDHLEAVVWWVLMSATLLSSLIHPAVSGMWPNLLVLGLSFLIETAVVVWCVVAHA